MHANDSRIVRVETVIDHINYRLDHIDKRFDKLESDVNKRFDEVKLEFKDMRSEINGIRIEGRMHFRWLMGFILVIVASPIYPQIIQTLHHIFQK